jgi:hypothetical protein
VIPASRAGGAAGSGQTLSSAAAGRSPWIACAVFLGYAAAYFAFLYQPGLIRMDDFGYLQGVVETLAAGRPVTHAWLEPYSATLSGLCALAYGLTGNFLLSTWGLQAAFVLGGAALLYRLLRERLSPPAAAGLALVLATQPSYWHKCSEFSGNVFTMAFVLGALLAYRRGRWGWFFLLAFMALANRQNSLALLALPAWHLVFDRAGSGESPARDAAYWSGKAWIAAGMMAFACAAFLLHLSLNRSIAQSYGIYSGMNAAKIAAILRTQVFGLLAALGFLSMSGLLMGEDPRERFRANLRKPWAPLAATAVLAAFPLLWYMPLLSFLTPLIGSLDRGLALQWSLLAILPCLFWTLDWRLIRFDAPLALVVAYVVLSSLKGFWYDFYLIDVALATVFFRLTREAPMRPGRIAFALGAGLLCAHALWAYGYRVYCDKQRLSITVLEGLERSGRIAPDAMTDGTFGYLGWKLFDHYWRHEAITDMAGYQGYVHRNRVVVETELPWRRAFKRDALPGGESLGEGRASIGYFSLRYRIRDLQDTLAPTLSTPTLVLDPAVYRRRPYPLDNREWSGYVEAAKATYRKEAAHRKAQAAGAAP